MRVCLKRACAMLMVLVMLLSLSVVPVAATEEPAGATDNRTVTFSLSHAWSDSDEACYVLVNLAIDGDDETFPVQTSTFDVYFNSSVLRYEEWYDTDEEDNPYIEPLTIRNRPVYLTPGISEDLERINSLGYVRVAYSDQNNTFQFQNNHTILRLKFVPAENATAGQTANLYFVHPTTAYVTTESYHYATNAATSETNPMVVRIPGGSSTHTVTVSGGTVSGGTASGDTFVFGDSVTITANAAPEGQRFNGWTGTDSLTFDRTVSPATFTMPDYDVTLTANYGANPVTHTVTVSGGTVSSGDTFVSGDSVTITAASAPDGQRFKEWTDTDNLTFTNGSKTTESATFTMPASDVSVAATYEAVYTVTVTSGDGGGIYVSGDSVTITAASAPDGQRFKEWTDTDNLTFTNGSKTTESATFTMPDSAVTVTATYEVITHNVTVTSGGGSGTYAVGNPVTITAASAPAGQRFKEWTGTDSLKFNRTAARATFTMPDSAVTVTATYEVITHNVTVTSGGGSGTYAVGNPVTITAASAPAGQRFKEWTGTDSLKFNRTAARTTFTMPDYDVTLGTAYEPIPVPTHNVTVTSGNGSGTYAENASVTITAASAPEGQRFKEWTGADNLTFTSGSKTTESATFTMPGNDVNVTATYELIPGDTYTVTVNNGSGSGQYRAGDTVRITAAAASSNGAFVGWVWTGPENLDISDIMSTDTSFTMPASDVSVTATYGGCYVATAVYGSYDCPEVWTLRRFRDKVLAKTWYGRLFIRLYYAVSPTAVRLFGQTSLFQNFFRSILDPWVASLQSDGFESTPYDDMPW